MNKQKQAFTLVELIVVITILAILWTIAFISLQWYSKDARDSIRISDVSNMKTSLELFHLDAGKYPLPDDNQIVDYGTETLWYQWDFLSTVISSLSRSISEVPTDPLTEKKYIFSVANNKNEFEILSLLEGDNLTLNNINQTNAASLVVTPKIDGTYNRVFIKTASYIVPVPSIINTEVWAATMTLDSSNISSQVINGWDNIPEQWNVISNTWSLTWLVLSVYTWSINIDTSNAEKEIVIEKIKDAYTGSILAGDDIYNYILSSSWELEIVTALNRVVLNDLTTKISLISNSCDDTTKPADDLNKTYIVNPTSVNQAYVLDSNECWYTCTSPYTWLNCDINPYSSCLWANNPTAFAATSTYGSCDTADIIICSWVANWYTLSACNVWTNIAWTTSLSYWELFQWWNNSPIKTASTSTSQIAISLTGSTFGDNTFVYGFDNWNSSVNDDLWWNNPWWDIDRKWPCEIWYHVPSELEWSWVHTSAWWANSPAMRADILIPWGWKRYWASLGNNAIVADVWSYGYYWSSSPNTWTTAFSIFLDAANINSNSSTIKRSDGLSVRCFKN